MSVLNAQGVHHMSFVVTDVERTVNFYRTALGFNLVSLGKNEGSDIGKAMFGSDYDESVPVVQYIAEMEMRGTRVEFIEYLSPRTSPYHGDRAVAGLAHLGLRVLNMEEELKNLERAGVKFNSRVSLQ